MNLFARLVCYAFMAYVVLPESYVSRYLLVELEQEPWTYEPEPQTLNLRHYQNLKQYADITTEPQPDTLPPVPDETTTEEPEPVALGRSMGGQRPLPPSKGNVKKILVPTSMYNNFFHEDCKHLVKCHKHILH